MRVYISGKITDLSVYARKFNFMNAEFLLMSEHDIPKNKIVNPLNIPPFLWIDCWLCYMISDLFVMIFFCNCIALQPNWMYSRGARIEKRIAYFLNFKVIEL